MKKIVSLIALCTVMAVAAQLLPPAPPAPPAPQTITFAWDYPEEELSRALTFHIYATTNLDLPPDQWVLVSSVPGTTTEATIDMVPAHQFFAVAASNFWGQVFSEAISTPHPPRSGQNLTVRRGAQDQ